MAKNSNTIESRVISVVEEQLGSPVNGIKMNSSFREDLGADELDFVEPIMNLENEFDVCIPNSEADKLTTVGEAVEYFKNKLAE